MPAINFQKQFADKVGNGEKRQTIRKGNRFKRGEKLFFYTGQRTKKCRKLGEGICTETYFIIIPNENEIYLDDAILTDKEKEKLARDDGFKNTKDMIYWFKNIYGLTFSGQLIKW